MATEDVNQTLIANAIGGGGGSADEIRKKLILAMMQEGTSTGPANWAQGLDRVAKAMLGGLELRDLDRSDREFRLGEQKYAVDQILGADGRPAGNAPTTGPRSASLPPAPTVVPNVTPRSDVPWRPVAPLTNATPQPDMETALQVQRQAMADAPDALGRAQTPFDSLRPPELGAARAQLMAGMQAAGTSAPMGTRPIGQNAILPPTPPADPAMALTAPQQPAGAIPPPLAPPGPPARPTLPAPRAAQVAQAPERTREQVMQDVARLQDRRTSAPVRQLILQKLSPQWKLEIIGDKGYMFNPRTRELVEVADATKPTEGAKNVADYNRATGQNLTLPQFEALTEAEKETAKLKAKSEFGKGEQRERQVIQGNIVVDDIDRSLKKITASPTMTTGLVGNLLSKVPGTEAGDLAGLLDTIKANSGFDQLNKMRQESPTGGALGNVTIEELKLLQAVQGDIVQSRSDAQLKDNLRRYKNLYLDTIHGSGKGPEREKLQYQQPRQPERGQDRTPQEGDTATGPRGQRMILRNGRWEPLS